MHKKSLPTPLSVKSGSFGKVWLHLWISTSAHGGQPSQISQSLCSHIPSFNLSMRWRSDMLPDRIFVRKIVAFRLIRASFICYRYDINVSLYARLGSLQYLCESRNILHHLAFIERMSLFQNTKQHPNKLVAQSDERLHLFQRIIRPLGVMLVQRSKGSVLCHQRHHDTKEQGTKSLSASFRNFGLSFVFALCVFF